MHRAHKNKPLSARQKLANKLISKKSYIVERYFATGADDLFLALVKLTRIVPLWLVSQQQTYFLIYG
ncbi:hypothetical protein SAMN05428977_10452 [Nitrosomonas sp. Nm166]|nr:hypothetical protein SAMN05428977_10452 [Nitrosomonas sp. Nm166]